MAIPNPKPNDWQIANAQELQVTDREVLALLRAAKRRVDAILNDLPAGAQGIRRAQLEHTRAKLLAEQATLFERLGDVVSARRARAASRSARLSAAADNALLALVGKGAQGQFLYESALQVSQRQIEAAMARMRLSALPLSKRIYNTSVWMNGRLGKLINETLATGLNAKEFAKRARDWFNPNTPGGVRYAAMRLARTEINNAFHAMSAEKYANTPWINEVQWNLSKSHPKPDICNVVAADSPFPADRVPARPHPQCMCYITPKPIEEDEFIDNFLNGDYDDFLDKELKDNGWEEPETKQPTASAEGSTHTQQEERRITIAPVKPTEPQPEPEVPEKLHQSDGYSPGNWQVHDDLEARIREMQDNIRTLNPALSDKENREFAEKLVAGTTEEGETIYKNGPHEVIFAGSGTLTPEQQQEFLGYVDHMQTKFPSGREMAIRVAPSSEFGWDTGGETTISTGHMRINERVIKEKIWSGMPVSKGVPSALYVLAHEWGHAFPEKADARNVEVHNHAVHLGDMSRYGTTGGDGKEGHAAEGYAEAFAEWALSEGKTTNQAAQEYARRFHWRERFGNAFDN